MEFDDFGSFQTMATTPRTFPQGELIDVKVKKENDSSIFFFKLNNRSFFCSNPYLHIYIYIYIFI